MKQQTVRVQAFIEVEPDKFVPFEKVKGNTDLRRKAVLLVAERIAEQVESLHGVVMTADEILNCARYRLEQRGNWTTTINDYLAKPLKADDLSGVDDAKVTVA